MWGGFSSPPAGLDPLLWGLWSLPNPTPCSPGWVHRDTIHIRMNPKIIFATLGFQEFLPNAACVSMEKSKSSQNSFLSNFREHSSNKLHYVLFGYRMNFHKTNAAKGGDLSNLSQLSYSFFISGFPAIASISVLPSKGSGEPPQPQTAVQAGPRGFPISSLLHGAQTASSDNRNAGRLQMHQ